MFNVKINGSQRILARVHPIHPKNLAVSGFGAVSGGFGRSRFSRLRKVHRIWGRSEPSKCLGARRRPGPRIRAKGSAGRVVAKQGEASDDASQTEFKMSWNSTTWHFSVRGQCEAKLKLSSYPDPWSTDFAAEFHAHTAFSLCHVLAITSRTCRTHPTLDSSFDDEVEGFVRRIPSPTWRPGPR